LTELAEITLRFPAKCQADDFITGKPIDDVVEGAIEENLSLIDDHDPVAQLRDILHVMTGEQGYNAMLGIVDPQKLAHPFLTNDIETNRRFIQKQHFRSVNKRADTLHLHPFAQR